MYLYSLYWLQIVEALLHKINALDEPTLFTLFVVRDSGEVTRCADEDHPLLVRLILGPREDLAKLFIMERDNEDDVVLSHEAAQYYHIAMPFLEQLVARFDREEEREIAKLREIYAHKKKTLRRKIEEAEIEEMEVKNSVHLEPS